MKVRTDYVSNSSSSSFVLANMEFFDHFDITKEDILNALVDAYGVEAYKKTKTNILKRVKEHPDWYEDGLKWNSFGPFYVYDLSIPAERKEAVARWGGLIENWIANNARRVSDEAGKKCVTIDPLSIDEYKNAISGIAKVYNIMEYELEEVAEGASPRGCTRFVRTGKKDPKTGLPGHYEPISKELVNVVREMRQMSGIMTNLDVVKSKVSRFFVHADDNELCSGLMCEFGNEEKVYNKDMDAYVFKEDSNWNTESCTYDRVCEMLLNYLVKIGKVKLDDPAFLEKMKVDEKHLTEDAKNEGRIYDFCDGLQFSWRDLKQNSLTWCMHEG